MGIWNKIWNGIKTFGTAIVSGLTAAAEGATVGSAAGPVGTVVGAISGALIGLVPNMKNIVDFVNNPDGTSDTTTVDHIVSRPADQVNSALSQAVANPSDPSSKVIINTLEGIKQGGTWRSSFAAAGGHQFGRALGDGQTQGLINKASAKMGVSPVTLMAHGNGAFRSLIGRQGQTNGNFHSINDHVLGAAYPIAAAAMSGTFGSNGGGIRDLQPASSGISM